jgi:hypothetical protein
MNDTLQAQLAAMCDAIGAAALSESAKHTASWCIGQLPDLYSRFRQTSEKCYGEEIVRLVRGVLQELAKSEKTCPEARQLAASFTARLRLLHEEFGLPRLNLQPRGASPPRSRKAG